MSIVSALTRFAKKPRDSDDITQSFARCFASDDGKIGLEHLHRQILFRLTEPSQDIASLRFHEGQRQLVLWLCQLAARGQNA